MALQQGWSALKMVKKGCFAGQAVLVAGSCTD